MDETIPADFFDLKALDDEPLTPSPAPAYVGGWIAYRGKPFVRESKKQCKRWQLHAIKLLSRGPTAYRKLAVKLRCCTTTNPCNSEACAFCMYHFRSRLLEQSINVMPVGGTAATIITNGIRCEVGSLDGLNVKKTVRRLQKRISRSDNLKDCLILGGLDVSLNLEIGKLPYWQVHLYVLIDHKKTEELKRSVRQAFPREPTAAKPYRFRNLLDRLEAVGYSYKMHFKKRFQYINEDTKKMNVGEEDIPDSYLPELLMFLDSYAIGGRMLLRGIRRHGRNLNLKVIAK